MKRQKVSLTGQIGRSIYIMGNIMQRYFHAATEEVSLSMVQRRILGFLLSQPEREIYQKDLEREFQLRKSTVTGILNGMEEKGFLRREIAVHDGRYKRIVPTEQAVSCYREVGEQIRQAENIMKKDIDREEMKICLKVLEQMIRNMEEGEEKRRK